MLHLSLGVPRDMFHGPVELEIAHLFIPSLGLPEPLHFWQPDLSAHCLDVLWWCSSWACEHLHDVYAHHDVDVFSKYISCNL